MNVHNTYQGEVELGEGESENIDSIVKTKNLNFICRQITRKSESHTTNVNLR